MRTGKLSVNVLKRSVLRPIKKRRAEVLSGAGVGADCAIFAFPEGKMVTCMVQAAVENSGSAMNRLVQKCANRLVSYGAEPVGISIALLLPEELEEQQLKALIAQAEEKAESLKLEITDVQVEVTASVAVPFATLHGVGVAARQETVSNPTPGQDVVVSKWIALEGTAVLAKTKRELLLTRYPAYLVDMAAEFDRFLSIIPEAATAGKSGVCAMREASEGGIFACLWELAERAGVGLTIDMRKLPIRQETVEICEQCGVNPYELMSGGCLVMTADDGLGLVSALQDADIPAVVVGKVTDSNDRILINGEEIRYMDKPKQDELYKCNNPEGKNSIAYAQRAAQK